MRALKGAQLFLHCGYLVRLKSNNNNNRKRCRCRQAGRQKVRSVRNIQTRDSNSKGVIARKEQETRKQHRLNWLGEEVGLKKEKGRKKNEKKGS